MKTFRRLLSYSIRYKKRFITGVVFALLTALLNAVSLTALIPLFDSLGAEKKERLQLQFTEPERKILVKEFVFGNDSLDGVERFKKILINVKSAVNRNIEGMEPKEVVWAVCKFVFPLYILKLFAFLASVFCIATTGYFAVRDIRQELYEKSQLLPLTFYYKEKTGVLMSRIINDVEIVAAVISSNLRDAIINFFYVITHLMILFYLNTELLIIAVLTVPIIMFPVTLFTRKITKSTARLQEKMADMNAHLQEFISGIKVIRSFRLEKREEEKFAEINQKAYRRNFKGQFYLQMAPSLVELTSSIVVMGFFAFGARYIATGQFTQGEFMAFLLTLLFLLRPMTQLSQMVGKVSQASVAGSRIFELMDREGEIHETLDTIDAPKLNNGIEFKNVRFIYPSTGIEVLKGIKLKVKAGETVAVVGPSGSGKSTLMDLIPRFFEPSDGSIEIDGVDIQRISLPELRKKIGIVTQDIFLFHGTVADNIAYGRPASSRKEIIQAARLAHAHDFIEEMENKYDTILGVRGLNLSGGQRQRLVIARALLRNPEIMIMDEATSALDVETEKLVSEALDRLFKNRTTFIIAHRLSTIRKIGNIIVMDQGRIVERGNHDSLIQSGGIYKKFYENQFNEGVM